MELRKLYELHEEYQKHEEKSHKICSCGKFVSHVPLDKIISFFEQEKNKKEVLDYLIEINPFFRKDICIAFLKATKDFKTFKEKLNGSKLGIYDKIPIEFINELYQMKLLDKKALYLCEKNWDSFKYKKDYIKKHVIRSEDLTCFLKEPMDLIKNMKLSKKIKIVIELKEFDLEMIEKIYTIVLNLTNYKHITTNLEVFKKLIEHKFIALASLINQGLALYMFLQIHNCLPCEVDDYRFELDYQKSRFFKIKYENTIDPLEGYIYFNDKLYKIT